MYITKISDSSSTRKSGQKSQLIVQSPMSKLRSSRPSVQSPNYIIFEYYHQYIECYIIIKFSSFFFFPIFDLITLFFLFYFSKTQKIRYTALFYLLLSANRIEPLWHQSYLGFRREAMHWNLAEMSSLTLSYVFISGTWKFLKLCLMSKGFK